MRAFIRLALFTVALAVVGIGPARTQQQPFASSLEDRVASLELKFRELDTLPQQIAELSAKIDRLSDPITQAPLRPSSSQPVAGSSQAWAAPSQVRYTTVCGPNGCAVVRVGAGGDCPCGPDCPCGSSFGSSGQTLAYSAPFLSRGPVRRALFGRWR